MSLRNLLKVSTFRTIQRTLLESIRQLPYVSCILEKDFKKHPLFEQWDDIREGHTTVYYQVEHGSDSYYYSSDDSANFDSEME